MAVVGIMRHDSDTASLLTLACLAEHAARSLTALRDGMDRYQGALNRFRAGLGEEGDTGEWLRRAEELDRHTHTLRRLDRGCRRALAGALAEAGRVITQSGC